jgi:hypothetical protein
MARKIAKANTTPIQIEWPRADPVELAKFDPATKTCTMNCGPHAHDPRKQVERIFLCGDCLVTETKQ